MIKGLVHEAKRYKLGDPKDPATTLGPVVSTRSANAIKEQIKSAGGFLPSRAEV